MYEKADWLRLLFTLSNVLKTAVFVSEVDRQ